MHVALLPLSFDCNFSYHLPSTALISAHNLAWSGHSSLLIFPFQSTFSKVAAAAAIHLFTGCHLCLQWLFHQCPGQNIYNPDPCFSFLFYSLSPDLEFLLPIWIHIKDMVLFKVPLESYRNLLNFNFNHVRVLTVMKFGWLVLIC